MAAGESESVRTQRERFQRLMEPETVAAVEEATGRTVRVCLADISPEAGAALHVYLCETLPETRTVVVADAMEEAPGSEP